MRARWVSLETFLVYGLVESALLVAVPSLTQPSHLVRDSHWLADVAVLAACAVLGIGCGVIIERLSSRLPVCREDPEQTAYFLSLLALLAVLGLWRAVCPMPFGAGLAVVLRLMPFAAVLGVVGAWALRARAPALWRFAGSPLLVSFAVFGPAWIMTEQLEGETQTVRAGAALAATAALAAAAELFRRVRVARRTLASPRARVAVTAALGVALCFLDAFVFRQTPLVAPSQVVAGSPSPQAPPVILLTLDTVRADHTSIGGYEHDTTPHLKALAESEATLYPRSYSAGDVTLSSHASLFTGLYPSRHHAVYDAEYPAGRPLSDRHETLAETLRDAGYRTHAVVGNAGFLSAAFGFAQGFGVYDARSPVAMMDRAPMYSLRRAVRSRVLGRFLGPRRIYRPASEINREALAAVDRMTAEDGPFFLFVNYMEAHFPYEPPAPYRERFPGRNASLLIHNNYFDAWKAVLQAKRKLTADEQAHLFSQYDGSIAYLDDELGRFFDALRERGVWDDALLVVTSDHGEAFGEHGLIGHGSSTFQEQVRVPLLVKFPGQTQARRIETPVSSVDVYAAILAAAGIEPPQGEGADLARMPGDQDRLVFSEHHPSGSLGWWKPERFQGSEYAASFRDRRLIRTSAGPRLLFDPNADPDESHPIDADREQRELLSAAVDLFVSEAPGSQPEDSREVDRNTLEQLRDLGYIQ